MPKKSIVKGFGKRWRQHLKGVAARGNASISKVANDAIDDIKEELDETAPYTQGSLLGREPRAGATIREPPVKPTGFVKFRREVSGKRTFVLTNSLWNIYGEKLESGEVRHNPDLGGRDFDPGFVARAITKAKVAAEARRRNRGS